MKKLLIINSVYDSIVNKSLASYYSEIIKSVAVREGKGIDIELCENNLSEDFPRVQIPRGFDAYLVHPRDVEIEDLEILRAQQPNSWIYCTNRNLDILREEERAIYDDVQFTVGLEVARKILKQIQNPRRQA